MYFALKVNLSAVKKRHFPSESYSLCAKSYMAINYCMKSCIIKHIAVLNITEEGFESTVRKMSSDGAFFFCSVEFTFTIQSSFLFATKFCQRLD